jgi:hypothetical protein
LLCAINLLKAAANIQNSLLLFSQFGWSIIDFT